MLGKTEEGEGREKESLVNLLHMPVVAVHTYLYVSILYK